MFYNKLSVALFRRRFYNMNRWLENETKLKGTMRLYADTELFGE